MNYPTGGSGELAFFQTPKGQSVTLITAGSSGTKTKSFRDTNMESAGVVPTKLFKFVGLSIGYVNLTPNLTTNATDRENVRCGGYLRFRIVDKDILFLPLVSLPEVNPYIAVSTTANATTINSSAGGGGLGVSMYRFPINITLNPFENFSVSLVFDGTVTVTAAIDIYLILQGFMRRPT